MPTDTNDQSIPENLKRLLKYTQMLGSGYGEKEIQESARKLKWPV